MLLLQIRYQATPKARCWPIQPSEVQPMHQSEATHQRRTLDGYVFITVWDVFQQGKRKDRLH